MSTDRRPNLFILGAMKSGTSSLHAYLGRHPQIYMSEEKEPGYFLDEFTWHKGEDWYLSLFDAAGDVLYRGESSTHYTKLPRFGGASERLHEFAPEARLIYIMRDPVQRTISHYWHMVMSHDESRDMLQAVQENAQYRNVSYYAMQLRPYLERFPAEQIYTLTFEALIAAPEEELGKLFRWLGVDHGFSPDNTGAGYNVGARQFVKPRHGGLLNRFRFSRTWDIASRFVPAPLRALGRRLAVREYDRSAQPLEPVIDYLRPIQREQTEELRQLLGRDFPEWTTLYGGGQS
ncbi:sulfotransferase [Thiohalobacter sp. IOR34]|uniref:sulfotransferase family protein n=1 Tax=Thiohalobacter sp. IOR34 TaxID=3057176 RepID=UPI0025AFB1AF|nr:sulfotransferase [Thiohalobacter sp. IOR34]WJW74447.1 sulfotransferase [Thiohalobacter sp. IOR34]